MTPDKNFRFLKVAKEMASKSEGMRRGFGAAIVDKNKIIAVGKNRKSHPRIPTNVVAYNEKGKMSYFALHAEIAALLRCDFSTKGMTIYIHGQNRKTKNLVNSEPCLLCRQVLKERGIKEAIYSIPEGYAVTLI